MAGAGSGALKTKEAEGIPAPITLNNVTKLERHFSAGNALERLIGVCIEDGKVKGATQVKKVGDLIEYRMIATGKGAETEAKLKELASQPMDKIIEVIKGMTMTHLEKVVDEVMRMSWAPDKEGKRQNQWDVVMYFEKTGQLAGVKSNLSDPRNPFEYIKQPHDQFNMISFLRNPEAKKALEL